MIRRMTISLGTLLLLAGMALAQAPADAPPAIVDEPGSSLSWWAPRSDGRFWITTDYLVAYMQGVGLPPLVTTSPVGTARVNAGVLGQATTTTLFGGDRVDEGARAAFRLAAGYWLDSERTLGIEVGTMMINAQGTNFSASSNDFPILRNPSSMPPPARRRPS